MIKNHSWDQFLFTVAKNMDKVKLTCKMGGIKYKKN